MEKQKISISTGNMKLGGIANFNLPPLKSCTAEACRACGVNGCYALKSYRLYPNVKTAWGKNLEMVRNELPEVERQLVEYLRKYKKTFFRVHSSGDFEIKGGSYSGVNYFKMWVRIAEAFPDIQFLAYTKAWGVIFDAIDEGVKIPSNFILRLSDWDGVYIPEELKKRFKVAYVVLKPEDAPEGAFICGGDCRTCQRCFFDAENVAFIKH